LLVVEDQGVCIRNTTRVELQGKGVAKTVVVIAIVKVVMSAKKSSGGSGGLRALRLHLLRKPLREKLREDLSQKKGKEGKPRSGRRPPEKSNASERRRKERNTITIPPKGTTGKTSGTWGKPFPQEAHRKMVAYNSREAHTRGNGLKAKVSGEN